MTLIPCSGCGAPTKSVMSLHIDDTLVDSCVVCCEACIEELARELEELRLQFEHEISRQLWSSRPRVVSRSGCAAVQRPVVETPKDGLEAWLPGEPRSRVEP